MSDAPLYFDDCRVGMRLSSASRTVGEAEIKAFAADYDPQPFHTDSEAARQSVFGGLAASGWHTAALTMSLLASGGLPIAGGIVGVNVEIAWPRPTRPGDTLRVESEIIAVAPSRSRPDRGLVTVRSETLNQAGEPVQILTSKLVVPRRPT